MSQVSDATSTVQAPFTLPKSGESVATQGLGKQDFLKLLVTQLQHQDPMDPTDPAQFVSQLAEFTSLEQLVNIRDGLDLLSVAQASGTSAQLVGFVGREIELRDDQVTLDAQANPVDLHFTLDGAAADVQVVVKDADGQVVRTLDAGALGEGDQTVTFDGKDENGNPLPAGDYTFEVVAKDADGGAVEAATRSTGVVAAVTFEDGYPELVLEDGRKVALGQVTAVHGQGGDGAAETTGASSGDEGGGDVDPDVRP